MSRKYLVILLTIAFVIGAFGNAFAVSSYVSSFTNTYPASATSSFSCSICHTSAPTRNAYGSAWASAGRNFRTIETADSDGDGFTNLAEITAGTNPGSNTSKPAPATCTSFTYSAWGACQSNNTQTRTVSSSLPAGCTGGTPVLSQACTYVPPVTACTGYTYSAWSACGSNGQQTRTVTGNTPAGCSGTPSSAAVLTQACTYIPPTCSSFTYSAWGACQSNNTQSRTVSSSSPAGCTGGTPVLSQACTYVPPVTACTGYTYSNWSVCENSQQSRTVTGNTPAGCAGAPASQPLLTQICNTPVPPAAKIPAPTSDNVFSYNAVELPIVSIEPDKAAPIGIGPVASGGDTIDITVNVGPFSSPVNVSLVLYAPSLDSDQLFFMSPSTGLRKVSEALDEDDDDDDDRRSSSRTSAARISRLVNWKTNVTSLNAKVLGPLDVSDVPSGQYTLVLVAKSPRNPENFYRWITQINIP